MEGNRDFCFDLVMFNIPMGHMEVSGMKLDVWLEAIRHSELEIQLENLSTGLGVSAQGKGLDRMSRGPGPEPEKLWHIRGNEHGEQEGQEEWCHGGLTTSQRLSRAE